MKTTLITITLTVLSVCAFAQTNKDKVAALINRGVALNDSGKYAEAIDKYKEALKIDSLSGKAYYELSYTLFSSGHGNDAIPYLEKVLKINPNDAGGYDMLGSIYDDDKQPEKAIEYYLKGIKADPQYQRLYYNVAITYYRTGKFKEAEQYAITAMKLEPKHASSQRIYAMTTYKLQKRACSLLAWCSFLILEPQTKRSAEAMAYVKNILNYGITKTGEKSVNLNVDPNNTGNMMMQMSALTATDNKKGLSAVDSLQLQLTSIFKICRTLVGDKEEASVIKYFQDYFDKLGNSDVMPALTRYLSISVYKDDNLAWFKNNEDKLKALDMWIRTTERSF